MTEVVELQKLKLAELKQECAARGLEVKGNKSELIARLQLYLEEHEEVNEEEVLGGYGEDSSDKEEREETQELAKHEDVTEKKVVKVTPPASASERMQKRAERFNIPPSADSKKAARAARFGMPAADSLKGTSAKLNVDVEVLKKRAERFGMNVSSVSKKVEDDEKLKKRKERFGVLTSSASAGTDDSEAKKRKRAERFGNV